MCFGKERWPRKTAQGANWIFCLTAVMMAANRSRDEQTTPLEHSPAFKANVALAAVI